MNELHLFAGCGGGILGGMLLGHRTVCAVELSGYCRQVLTQRQRDGFLPRFPIWDDITTFDGSPWRGIADVVCGGFPCQDISAANTTGGAIGIDGERSGLWREMARVIGEVGPRYAFVENSPMLTSRGLGAVLGDLAEMGFDARWGIVSAANVGAPHIRERIWILANARRFAWRNGQEYVGRGFCELLQKGKRRDSAEWGRNWKFSTLAPGIHPRVAADWWRTQRAVDRSVNGLANGLDRLKAAGNGQVPIVAATAWRLLKSNE